MIFQLDIYGFPDALWQCYTSIFTEYIWAQLKKFVRKFNSSFNKHEVLALTHEAWDHVDQSWSKVLEHIEKVIFSY